MGAHFELIGQGSDTSFQERLYAYLEHSGTALSPQEKELWNHRYEEYQEYLKRYVRAPNVSYGEKGSVQKLLTYDSLSDILRIWGMNGRDACEIMGVTFGWPTEAFRLVASYCDSFDQETLNRVHRTAYELSNSWWKQEEIANAQPTVRGRSWFIAKIPYAAQKEAPEKLYAAARSSEGFMSIPFSVFPEVSAYLEVSPHWLLKLSPDIPFYGDKALLDQILDAFSFMSEEARAVFLLALQEIQLGGGEHG